MTPENQWCSQFFVRRFATDWKISVFRANNLAASCPPSLMPVGKPLLLFRFLMKFTNAAAISQKVSPKYCLTASLTQLPAWGLYTLNRFVPIRWQASLKITMLHANSINPSQRTLETLAVKGQPCHPCIFILVPPLQKSKIWKVSPKDTAPRRPGAVVASRVVLKREKSATWGAIRELPKDKV